MVRKKTPFSEKELSVGLWSFDENGERFTDTSRGSLKRVRTVLEATLTRLDVEEDGTVTQANFGNLARQNFSVKATHFVLAAGAMETVRLLLGAVPNRPNGFGNAHDQLGRFFMEHPHARGGQIIPVKCGNRPSLTAASPTREWETACLLYYAFRNASARSGHFEYIAEFWLSPS